MLFHLAGGMGVVFLPMHLPVLLAGFFLGPRFGLLVGIITPLLSSLLTGMPPLLPLADATRLIATAFGRGGREITLREGRESAAMDQED